MLRVVYEAADDLTDGQPVEVTEDRGLIKVRIDRTLDAPAYTQAVNRELNRFLADAEWYQLGRDRIRSPRDTEAPVRVWYLLDRDGELDHGDVVEIREGQGRVEILVEPDADVVRFVAALNPAVEAVLDGGRWFQHWQGEIVDVTSPEAVEAEV